MKRRSFLAMLGLAPVAGAAVAKGLMPLPAEAKAAGVYRSTSLFLDVPAGTGPTRIVLDADKFRIGSVDAYGHILIEEV